MSIGRAFLLLLCLFISCPAGSQTATRLVPGDIFTVQSEWGGPILSPVRCDGDGNLYIREYASGTANNVITIVTSIGDKVVKTSLDAEPELKNGKLADFGVGPSGELLELIQVDHSVYLVKFKRDGNFTGTIKLEKEFWPSKLAVGEASGVLFLISGTELPVPEVTPRLFDGLFDASGRMVRVLKLSGDPAQIEAKVAKISNDKSYFEDKASFPLQLGTAEADLNGNFYLIRASEPPVVFVLNASGEFVRRLEIQSPEPGMRLLAAHVNSGRLAALLAKTSPDGQILSKTMMIVDVSNGDTVQRYAVSADLGSAFACYSGNDFIFITTKDKKLAIQHAQVE